MKKIGYLFGIVTLGVLLNGCSSGSDGLEAAAAVGLTADVVERAVTVSAQGDQATAVALLLEGTETADTAVAPATSLGWSESHFKGLSEPELTAAQDENKVIARAARSLRVAAIAAIEEAQAAGESEKASRWLQRLDAAGQVLAGNAYNALLNLEGEGIVKKAAEASK